MAIKVSGSATLKVDFEVELNMTEEELDAMPYRKLNELLDSTINWSSIMSNAEVDDFEVYEVWDAEEKTPKK
ncbi:hypothetical protein DHX103_14305 [Planococcus sp. X10-3]|uniref:hypothetical protein n=1 Tax=Planococcus sp. X10-3 TaxID=3061240 RepID=UPI003BB1779C